MFTILQTEAFSDWLHGLRDRRAVGLIAKRIVRMGNGNLGDVKNLGDGLSEARIFSGPGYRLYFTQQDGAILILLCGGNKGTQGRDIDRARQMMTEI